MRNQVIVGIISFTAGALTGGYVVGKACARKHREILAEIKGETKEERNQEIEEKREPAFEYDDNDYDFNDPFAEEDDRNDEQEKTDYAALSKKYHSEDFNRHFGDRANPTDEEYDPDDIYTVDVERFKKEIAWRDDETITYYQQDDVLVDSTEHVISDKEKVIGVEGLEEVKKTDQDAIYVSNDVEDKIYEVVIEHMYSYRDIVGGGAGE